MNFTSASMLNRWGTPSTTGVGVRNHRIRNRRASHSSYKTIHALTRGVISKSFNIHNSDTWRVSYTNPLNDVTITLNNGSWLKAPVTHTLQNIVEGTLNDIFFNWPVNTNVKQTIVSIDDNNNTITWTTLDSETGLPYPGHVTIVWRRV